MAHMRNRNNNKNKLKLADKLDLDELGTNLLLLIKKLIMKTKIMKTIIQIFRTSTWRILDIILRDFLVAMLLRE